MRNIRCLAQPESESRSQGRKKIGCRFAAGVLLIGILFAGVFAAPFGHAQESGRKLITRVEPDYPDALKKLYIGGVVRVEVKIAPNGTVKSTKLLGGSPILGQSTMKAIMQWKYAPAPTDETLTIKIEFDPHR